MNLVRDYRVFTHNLQKKNQRRWMRRVIDRLGSSMDNCVALLQEVASWEAAEYKGYSIITRLGDDCGVAVPRIFSEHVGDTIFASCFTAVLIFRTVFISVHLPDTGKPDVVFEETLEALTVSLQSLKSRNKYSHIVMGGDLNYTLPPNLEGISGPLVASRTAQSKRRGNALIRFLSEFDLRAVNTWRGGAHLSDEPYTWYRRKMQTQIDYILVSSRVLGEAGVESNLGIRSDHKPVIGCFSVEGFGEVVSRPSPLLGWEPLDNDASSDFKRDVLSAVGIGANGSFDRCRASLCDVESAVFSVASAARFTTASFRRRSHSQKPPHLVALRRAWKATTGAGRKHARELYSTAWRSWRRQQLRSSLSSVSATGSQRTNRIPCALVVENVQTTSRQEWSAGVRKMCQSRYLDSGNSLHVQRTRLSCLSSVISNLRLDGCRFPVISFGLLLRCRGAMKCARAAGADGIVNEIWKACPLAVLVLIWQLFGARLSDFASSSVSTFWKLIELVGIPKTSLVKTLEDFRYIAKTPTLQKWYLRCLVELLRSSKPETQVHSYGFRPRCSTMLVTELIRQMLHKSRQWGRCLHIFSGDILTAFDALGHGEIYTGLLSNGANPLLIRAIMQEYYGLQATVQLLDAPTSDKFTYSRGGRQGGAETPELFRVVLDTILHPLVSSWKSKKYGFTIDDKHFITHAIWCDNVWLFGKSVVECKEMADQVTSALYAHGFKWKPTSLECLNSLCSDVCDFHLEEPIAGSQLLVQCVENMTVLGVLLDSSGSTSATIQHRQAAAGRCFHKYAKLLQNPLGGVQHRLTCYCQTVRATMCYNAGGWHINAQTLRDLIAWENQMLRRVFKFRRFAGEDQFSFNTRTAAIIWKWFSQFGLPRVHEFVLSSVHSWSSDIFTFEFVWKDAPLATLVRTRCDQHWVENRAIYNFMDSHNHESWRHWNRGKNILSWEHVLCVVHGLEWKDGASQDPTLWKRLKRDFVSKCCVLWELKTSRSNSHCELNMAYKHAALRLPLFTQTDHSWQHPQGCFECRVDCKVVHDWVNGFSAVSSEYFQNSVDTTCEILLRVFVQLRRTLRSPCASWVQWIPRERNRMADLLCNIAMDGRGSFRWQRKSGPATGNIVCMSDGGARVNGAAAAGWVIIEFSPAPAIIALGAQVLHQATSLQAECEALHLGVQCMAAIMEGHKAIMAAECNDVVQMCESFLVETLGVS